MIRRIIPMSFPQSLWDVMFIGDCFFIIFCFLVVTFCNYPIKLMVHTKKAKVIWLYNKYGSNIIVITLWIKFCYNLCVWNYLFSTKIVLIEKLRTYNFFFELSKYFDKKKKEKKIHKPLLNCSNLDGCCIVFFFLAKGWCIVKIWLINRT